MKMFISLLTLITLSLSGLFLYQNWTRTILLDGSGNSLSLDLLVFGLAYPASLNASQLILVSFCVGLLVGLILPKVVNILKVPRYQ